jgi:hypothetical protein
MGTTVHKARVAFIMTSSLVKVTFRQNSYGDWQILRAIRSIQKGLAILKNVGVLSH